MSSTINTNTYADITQICEQRRRRQLLLLPANRLELQPSPYPQFAAFDLNMRRKAEILKYEANKTNTKTNRFTKAELFAQLVQGNLQRRTYSSGLLQDIVDRKTVCSNNEMRPMPTSSSDVPGPIILLYEDPAIPLYNYVTNTDAYSILTPTNNEFLYWITYINNTIFPAVTATNFFTLYIDNNVPQDETVFMFTTPIGLHLENNTTSSSGVTGLTFAVSSVIVQVYYNSILILTNDPFSAVVPVSSVVPAVNITGLVPLVMNTTTNQTYSATLYSGNLVISNLRLPTQPGYIYDIFLTFSATTSSSNTSIVKKIYTNLSPAIQSVAGGGCVITGSASSSTNGGFLLQGG